MKRKLTLLAAVLATLSCSLFLCSVTLSPVKSAYQNFRADDFSQKYIDSMKSAIGKNITLSESYQLQSLIALSFYPDLKDKKITFAFGKIGTTMQCRPTPASLFGKGERQYLIFINNDPDFEGVLLKDVPFNAQVGVIGHELAHIVDYEQKNAWEVMRIGLSYFSARGKRKTEHRVDDITIERGLGWQIYDWSYFVLEQSKASDKYKAFKRKIYWSPYDICTKLENTGESF